MLEQTLYFVTKWQYHNVLLLLESSVRWHRNYILKIKEFYTILRYHYYTFKRLYFTIYFLAICPFILVKTCGPLEGPKRGKLECFQPDLRRKFKNVTTILPVDTICKFTCNEGYILSGSKERTCLPIARWSGLKTLCKRNYFLFSLLINSTLSTTFSRFTIKMYINFSTSWTWLWLWSNAHSLAINLCKDRIFISTLKSCKVALHVILTLSEILYRLCSYTCHIIIILPTINWLMTCKLSKKN